MLPSTASAMKIIVLSFLVFACTNNGTHGVSDNLMKSSRRLQGSNVFDSACAATLYPDVCMSTLSSRHQSPTPKISLKDFAQTSVKVSLDQVQTLSAVASSASKVMALQSSADQSKHTAVEDCMALFKYTIRQLNESVERLTNRTEWTKQDADDVQTWLSASLTDHETCLQGLKSTDKYHSVSLLTDRVRNSSRLVSNSLAIVKTLPVNSLGHNKRRLLSDWAASDSFMIDDGYPSWLSAKDRRLLQTTPAGGVRANTVVAKDGTGNFMTISDAVKAAPSKTNGRYVIHVKAGVYKERVDVSKDNIMLIGDGKDVTIVTGSKAGGSLLSIAPFSATGKGFIARDMGFENTAGSDDGQAIALRVASDESAFFRCSIKSFQDTLYAYSLRQFYRECEISGSVDFIFGDAAAVFQSCNIISRKRSGGSGNFVTAHGRTDPNQNTGFSIQNCRVTAESIKTYLGRPWKKYARTVFMQSFLDGNIDPKGWSEWSGSFALSTLYYGEYMNSGPGAGTGSRVTWPGYHHIIIAAEANKFTVAELISGSSWLPSTGIAFQAGLVG